MARRGRSKRPKKVNYTLIPRDSEPGKVMYPMLDELVHAHHSEISGARIALAWHTGWKADADGHTVLGKAKKASDLDRELVAIDFVIMLSATFWQDAVVSDDQRRALLDHELCHCSVKVDDNGDKCVDERGRIVYRMRKHDIEEFSEIVARHGTYKRDLEVFAAALRRSKQGSLLDDPKSVAALAKDPKIQQAVEKIRGKAGNGTTVTISSGAESVELGEAAHH